MLAETEVPPLLTRLGRLVSYFTIQSNLLVAVTAVQLARDPAARRPVVAPGAAAALVGITVTGLVHFVLLRPLLRPRGRELGRRQAAAHGRPAARRRRLARSPGRARAPRGAPP